MTWLVTGGAGYIGAHLVRLLADDGRSVVVLDDFSSGIVERVPAGVEVVRCSVLDHAGVRNALLHHGVVGVVHFAARKSVPESVERPLHYYRHNVEGLGSLLAAMVDTGVRRLVFSSSAAVYGATDAATVSEASPTAPVSPYGQTKLTGEWLVSAVAAAEAMGAVSLRYFNVAGAGAPELADTGATNLVPRVLDALAAGRAPQVYGDDWPTADGSCIRDYVHVSDVAAAHLAAMERTAELAGSAATYNIGRGRGCSVLEVVRAASDAVGVPVAPDVVGRRAGDVASMVADASLIERDLGWRATHDLDDIVGSAWQARAAARGVGQTTAP